ncbi:unnamed protein product [Eruca vesicaria subsp. sativa]|uniref:Myb-like domain-containing protein n=1 Tax=Eruca vesicaria subsp. sativa TaxID=29727 RepID=A0ABC8JGQ8_ERUVS|nr:unnamed protein product [Eruca vesicaria subsp. sativa]
MDSMYRPQRHNSEEVCSVKWEFIKMSQQEEDLILRMYKLVGDRWEIIAGRVPGRKAVEIERYWIMRNNPYFLPPPSCKS